MIKLNLICKTNLEKIMSAMCYDQRQKNEIMEDYDEIQISNVSTFIYNVKEI